MARLIPSSRARVVSPIVTDARAEAAAIRAEATLEASGLRERAEREGRAAGEAKIIGVMLEATREAAELRESSSREVASLALEVAGRIVHEAVSIDPALLERIVARSLARARSESRVELRLHPDDRAALVARLASHGGLPDAIRVVDAPDQARGGCVVRSERITIDARVESALAAIARAMGVDAPER